LLQERQSSGDRHNQVGSRQEDAPLNPKENAFINESLKFIQKFGVDKWREMTIDRYKEPIQKYVTGIIDKLPEDKQKAFDNPKTQNIVSSQKSGADQLVNPEQKLHDKSSSANLPQILEKRPDVQHGGHDQEASSSRPEDAPLNPKESAFITDIIDKVPEDKQEAFDTQKTQDVQHGGHDQEASSSRPDSSSNKQYTPEQGQEDQIEFIPLKQIFIESLGSIRDIAYEKAEETKGSRRSKKTNYKDWKELGEKIDIILDKNTEEQNYKDDLVELKSDIVKYPQRVKGLYKEKIEPFLDDYL
jgi:hypothetical protein